MRLTRAAVPGSPEAMPQSAWEADEAARRRGRVEIFNVGRPGGLDGWTMDVQQYEAVRALILEVLSRPAEPAKLMDLVAHAQRRLGHDARFPGGRLRNYTIYVKVDLEARGVVRRLPGSPQRVELC